MSDDRPDARAKARRRFRRRHAIVLAVVAVLVFGIGGYSAGTIFLGWTNPVNVRPGAEHSCDTTPVAAATGPVKVRVLNSTKRPGLAKRTARKLKKRGFAIVRIGNDSHGPPPGTQVRIRYADTTRREARTAATQFKNAEMKSTGGDSVVDVVLGSAFTGLRKAKAAKADLKTPQPLPCNQATPSGTPSSDRPTSGTPSSGTPAHTNRESGGR